MALKATALKVPRTCTTRSTGSLPRPWYSSWQSSRTMAFSTAASRCGAMTWALGCLTPTTMSPYIIAGSANGFLRTGQHLDFDNLTNNRLFNTLLAAAGVSNADGTAIEDFGDASLVRPAQHCWFQALSAASPSTSGRSAPGCQQLRPFHRRH